MSSSSRSRKNLIIAALLLLLGLLALLLIPRCSRGSAPTPAKAVVPTPMPVAMKNDPPVPSPPIKTADEVLTPATVQAPVRVAAGAPFQVRWTGPDNVGDYLTIVHPGDEPASHGNYRDTRHGAALEMLAPIDPGEWEVRYVAARSKTILGRAPLTVEAVGASIEAVTEVIAGAKFSVTWQGPKNPGDYLTIVAKGTPDGEHRNYADTAKGSPLELVAPIEPGDAEIRYMSGQRSLVLARRAIQVLAAAVKIEAPDESVVGAAVSITWVGPKNAGDYLTIVPKTARDGEHGNYADVAKGSPLNVAAPMQAGQVEIRYMSGQGAKVLGRRTLTLVPARIQMNAPGETTAGGLVSVEWTGPNNAGDHFTIVPKNAKDGVTAATTPTSRGSPATLAAPKELGPCEIRYMSGQGHLVLARASIDIR